MKTTIDNNQRVFMIARGGLSTRHFFCNLKDIPMVLAELEMHDPFTISELWNGKFKRIGKRSINEMFESNKIDFRIK